MSDLGESSRDLLIEIRTDVKAMRSSVGDHETRLRTLNDDVILVKAALQERNRRDTRTLGVLAVVSALFAGLGDRIVHLIWK